MVRVRDKCEPNMVVHFNKYLSEIQKSDIRQTPFKSLMQMPEKPQISENLLLELVSRWDERRMGFRIQGKVVRFTPLDVCFAIGLRIVGVRVSFDSDKGDESRLDKMFDGENITIPTIVAKLEKLTGDEHVFEFCKLYILLGFAEFYIPNMNGSVNCSLSSYLDDLNSVDKYCWGVVIYEFLVSSLVRASKALREGNNSHNLYLTGCAAVLQIWALEHLSFDRSGVTSFPQFKHWVNVVMQKEKMSEMLANFLVYQDLAASNEDLLDDVLKEAMQDAPGGFVHWHRPTLESLGKETCVLDTNAKELEQTISVLAEELTMLSLNLRSSPQTTQATSISAVADYAEMLFENINTGTPGESWEMADVIDPRLLERSNLYSRMKGNPRNQTASAVVQSLFITYYRKQMKNPVSEIMKNQVLGNNECDI